MSGPFVETESWSGMPASLTLLDRIGFEHVRDIEEDDGSTTRVLTRHRTAADRSSLARSRRANLPLQN